MKKFFKIILIILLSAIVIIAIALLVFTLSNRMFIGGTDETHTSYLNSNKIVIHIDNPLGNSKSTVFNHSVYTSKIVLLGETHGYAEVQDIDKALLFHFNKTKGTRYYVAEIDSLTADKLNLFLKKPEKDTLLLKGVVANVKRRIIQQAGRELFNKWSDVYDYNRTLPDSLRISVIGLDKSVGDTLKIPRDSVMAMRLAALMEQPGMENETFYGLFGMFHVFQEGVTPNNVLSLAARLKDRNISVKSIVCMQVDSEVYMPKEAGLPTPGNEKLKLLNMDGPLVLVNGINDLKTVSNTTDAITLFNLEGEGSPYTTGQRLLKTKTNFFKQDMSPYDETLPTADFFQYIVFLRGANAVTPIK